MESRLLSIKSSTCARSFAFLRLAWFIVRTCLSIAVVVEYVPKYNPPPSTHPTPLPQNRKAPLHLTLYSRMLGSLELKMHDLNSTLTINLVPSYYPTNRRAIWIYINPMLHMSRVFINVIAIESHFRRLYIFAVRLKSCFPLPVACNGLYAKETAHPKFYAHYFCFGVARCGLT